MFNMLLKDIKHVKSIKLALIAEYIIKQSSCGMVYVMIIVFSKLRLNQMRCWLFNNPLNVSDAEIDSLNESPVHTHLREIASWFR